MEDTTRSAEQTAAIEAARAYLAEGEGRVIEPGQAGRLLGHLMTAEVLLTRVTDAFTQSATTA